jgi:transposase
VPRDFFDDPDPTRLYVGEQPLHSYLEQVGLGWIVQLRTLLREVDIRCLLGAYKTRGRKSLHPALMLGLIVYGMLSQQWSLRQLEMLAKRDVGAWWLCGGRQPDHSTIGKFILLHQQQWGEPFFQAVVQRVVQLLRLQADTVAIDGTVLEAVASRYRLLKAEAAQQAAAQARQQAEQAPTDEKKQQAAQQAQRVAEVAQQRQDKRKQQRRTAGAVVVAPSEPDAYVQPTKHKVSRPSYKPSVAVQQRVILGQAVDPSSETQVVVPLMKQYQQSMGQAPTEGLLDSGYSEIGLLTQLEQMQIPTLCPDQPSHAKPGTQRFAKRQFDKSAFVYQPQDDCYLCPAGQRLYPLRRSQETDGRALVQYQGRQCGSCPQRSGCTRASGGRIVKRYQGEELKEQMRQRFLDPQVRARYKRRAAMVEPVFAELRERQGLKRFHRRGLSKVKMEFALHCVAFNLKSALRQARRPGAGSPGRGGSAGPRQGCYRRRSRWMGLDNAGLAFPFRAGARAQRPSAVSPPWAALPT